MASRVSMVIPGVRGWEEYTNLSSTDTQLVSVMFFDVWQSRTSSPNLRVQQSCKSVQTPLSHEGLVTVKPAGELLFHSNTSTSIITQAFSQNSSGNYVPMGGKNMLQILSPLSPWDMGTGCS